MLGDRPPELAAPNARSRSKARSPRPVRARPQADQKACRKARWLERISERRLHRPRCARGDVVVVARSREIMGAEQVLGGDLGLEAVWQLVEQRCIQTRVAGQLHLI